MGPEDSPLQDTTKLRETCHRCQAELTTAERKDGPLDPVVEHCGCGHERLGQKATTAAREKPRVRELLQGMSALDEMDPRGLAFLEASAKNNGAATRAVTSSWPTKQRCMSPEQFTTGACIHVGFPIPAPLLFVGNRIGSTNRRVDPHGHRLASATLKRDGWRKRHDLVQVGLKACHVDARLEVLNLFLPHCPAEARSHLAGPGGRRNRQGVVPDLLAFFDPKR